MSNSKLVNCTVLSPNHSGKRTHVIDRITPHCVVGSYPLRQLGDASQAHQEKRAAIMALEQMAELYFAWMKAVEAGAPLQVQTIREQ